MDEAKTGVIFVYMYQENLAKSICMPRERPKRLKSRSRSRAKELCGSIEQFPKARFGV